MQKQPTKKGNHADFMEAKKAFVKVMAEITEEQTALQYA
jgi:hypothetical protein